MFDGEVLVVGQQEDAGFFRCGRGYCKRRSRVTLAVCSVAGKQCEQEGGGLTDWGDFELPGELQALAPLLVAHGAVIPPLVERIHDVDLQTGPDLLLVVVPERVWLTVLRRGTDGPERTNPTLIGYVPSGIDHLSAGEVFANARGAENSATWLSQHKLHRLNYIYGQILRPLFVLVTSTKVVLYLSSALHHFLLLQDANLAICSIRQ